MTPARPRSHIAPLHVRARESRPQPRGLPVINLSFNELPFTNSGDVQNAINEATANANIYGNPSCELLRRKLAEVYSLNADHLICGNGSEELLDVIGRVFARPGDEILISEYGYIQFPIIANRVGATLVKAAEKNFTTDIDRLLAAVTDRTTLVFLANPNNPTATMVDTKALRRLAQSLPTSAALVIDLAYGEFATAGYCASMHELVCQHENIIVTRTFSKAFGLAGLRIGWLHAPEWMIPSLYAARGMGTANAAGQAAAIAALIDRQNTESNISLIVSERERVSRALVETGFEVIPSSANFMMTRLKGGSENQATDLATHLFDDVGILINQTREDGLQSFIRFSLSLPDNNTLLLCSMKRFAIRSSL